MPPQSGGGAPGQPPPPGAQGFVVTQQMMGAPNDAMGKPRRKHRVLKTVGILFLALVLITAIFEVTGVNNWIGDAYRARKAEAEKTGAREGLEKFVANHPNARITSLRVAETPLYTPSGVEVHYIEGGSLYSATFDEDHEEVDTFQSNTSDEDVVVPVALMPSQDLDVDAFVAFHEDSVARMDCQESYSPEPSTMLEPAPNGKYFMWSDCGAAPKPGSTKKSTDLMYGGQQIDLTFDPENIGGRYEELFDFAAEMLPEGALIAGYSYSFLTPENPNVGELRFTSQIMEQSDGRLCKYEIFFPGADRVGERPFLRCSEPKMNDPVDDFSGFQSAFRSTNPDVVRDTFVTAGYAREGIQSLDVGLDWEGKAFYQVGLTSGSPDQGQQCKQQRCLYGSLDDLK